MVEKLKEDHFEGGSNLNQGSKKGDEGHLAEILNKQADAINAGEQAVEDAKDAALTEISDAKNAALDEIAASEFMSLDSEASLGGGATEALVVTGLLSTDVILSVSQMVKGANSLPLLGFNTQADDALTAVWSADPGVGAIIKVLFKRV